MTDPPRYVTPAEMEAGSEFGGLGMDPHPLPYQMTPSDELRIINRVGINDDDTTPVPDTVLVHPSIHGGSQ